MLTKTHTEHAPWTIVESHDRRYATLKVFETVVWELGQKLRALDFFETINFNTNRRPGTDLLDIDIEVVEKATGSFSIPASKASLPAGGVAA